MYPLFNFRVRELIELIDYGMQIKQPKAFNEC